MILPTWLRGSSSFSSILNESVEIFSNDDDAFDVSDIVVDMMDKFDA